MRTIPLESDIREVNLPREYVPCFFDSDMLAIGRPSGHVRKHVIVNPSAVPYIPAKFPGAVRRVAAI